MLQCLTLSSGGDLVYGNSCEDAVQHLVVWFRGKHRQAFTENCLLQVFHLVYPIHRRCGRYSNLAILFTGLPEWDQFIIDCERLEPPSAIFEEDGYSTESHRPLHVDEYIGFTNREH